MNQFRLQNELSYQDLVNEIYHENPYDFVAIALQQNTSPHLTKWYYAAGNQNQQFRKIILRRGFGIAGMVLKTGKPFLNNHLNEFTYSHQLYTPIAKVEDLNSAIAVPITSDLMTISGVLLAGRRNLQHFEPNDLDNLKKYLSK